MGSSAYLKGSVFSWLLCAAALALIPWASVPSIDEIGTADTAVNLALNGVWVSHCWQYSYNLLHLFLLTLWLKLFGVSHFTVCAFNVVTAGVAAQCLLALLHRRRLLSGLMATCLVITLYWGGTMLAFDVMLGRIDMLALLFTVLVVDEISRPALRLMPLLVKSFLCMASAVYPVPIIVFFGVFLLVFAKDRLAVLQKGVLFLIGVMLAFMSACIVYAFEGQLIRFVHTYFSFNATIAGGQQPLFLRMLAAYGMNLSFDIILGGDIILLAVLRPPEMRKWVRWTTFVALIPALLALSGRCAPYYMWLAYVPAVLLAGVLVSGLRKRTIGYLFVVMSVVWIGGSLMLQVKGLSQYRAEMSRFADFISAHGSILAEAKSVALAPGDDALYYAVQGKGRLVWRLTDEEIASPREKFIRAVTAAKLTDERRRLALDWFDRLQVQQPDSPTKRTLLVCRQNPAGERMRAYLSARGYELSAVAQTDEFAMLIIDPANE